MSDSWPTQHKDLMIAQQLMSLFMENGLSNISLFELEVDYKEKKMKYKVADWVHALADHYASIYGEEEGEIITRRVISHCIRDNNDLH